MSNRITLSRLYDLKQQGQPITMLTCYDAPTAAMLEKAGIDSILVGDSLAQVVLGHDSTLPATMEIMLAITAAVRRGAPNVFLLGDMPFLSYQVTIAQAVQNAGLFLTQAGCDAVKIEVDRRHLETVSAMAAANIPVIAHLGYRPQSAYQSLSVVKGRQVEQALTLLKDCLAMEQAGAVALLLECVAVEAAQTISQKCKIPVISCGSGPGCDGQVIVLHDLMGLPGAGKPKFVKPYCQVEPIMLQAAKDYVAETAARKFPDDQHSYHMSQEDVKKWHDQAESL